MSRPIGSVKTPTYRHHKPSGQAVVTIGFRDHYIGPWKSTASRAEYDRLVSEWLANGRQAKAPGGGLVLVQLIAQYWAYAETYFTDPAGHKGQLENLRSALRIVKELYGHTPAVSFGPLALRAIREAMIGKGWSRTHINAQVGRVKRMVKWAVANELLPPNSRHALEAVEGLRAGKTKARETDPVRPVSPAAVEAVLPFLSPQVKAMVELQSCTGMRSDEICQIRTGDIDTTGKLWSYRPGRHKTKNRGHERVVYFNSKAQEIVKPFLRTDLQAHIFQPTEAEALRRAQVAKERKTPAHYGNAPGTNRKRNPKKQPGVRYTTSSYRQAVQRACDKAFPLPARLAKREGETTDAWKARLTAEERVEAKKWRKAHRWHPHQIRHAHGTNVRRRHGVEAAQAALGQRSLSATQIYAEKSQELAQRVAGDVG